MGNTESGVSTPRDYQPQGSFPATNSFPETSSAHQNFMPPKHANYIADNFSSLDQVISALRDAGLESSNLILGIDFTKSNEWTGKHSFNRRSLHAIGGTPNPYEQAISIIGQTLSPFDDDNLIPCFGFGDASTHDQYVFSFYPDHRPCCGFEEALKRYREIVPHLYLSGPTSFAPLIHASIDIVERTNWQYHVLVIVADGQVTNNPQGGFSQQEQATIDAIVAASFYPLSIIMVGVGDGPWDAMQKFDDYIPHRSFDNFQFVNFTKLMSTSMDMEKKEAAFALAALMEIPFQYKSTQSLQLRNPREKSEYRPPLPPPRQVIEHNNAVEKFSHPKSFRTGHDASHLPDSSNSQSSGYNTSSFRSTDHNVKPSPSNDYGTPTEQACPVCLTNPKDMAFNCGHMTCRDCGASLSACPLCRARITTRLRIYSS